MGLFDGWRRKKRRSEAAVKLEKPERVIVPSTKEAKEVTGDEISALLREYEELGKRKEALQNERDQLTVRLENGEIDANTFRKELMNKIQEAATVSEQIQVTGAKLVSLGYRGIL